MAFPVQHRTIVGAGELAGDVLQLRVVVVFATVAPPVERRPHLAGLALLDQVALPLRAGDRCTRQQERFDDDLLPAEQRRALLHQLLDLAGGDLRRRVGSARIHHLAGGLDQVVGLEPHFDGAAGHHQQEVRQAGQSWVGRRVGRRLRASRPGR